MPDVSYMSYMSYMSYVNYTIKIAKDLAGDPNTGIFFPSADTIAFTEGGTEAMRISSDGDVGIGTTAPTSKLQVEGNITATGSITATGRVAGAQNFANQVAADVARTYTVSFINTRAPILIFCGYQGGTVAGSLRCSQVLFVVTTTASTTAAVDEINRINKNTGLHGDVTITGINNNTIEITKTAGSSSGNITFQINVLSQVTPTITFS